MRYFLLAAVSLFFVSPVHAAPSDIAVQVPIDDAVLAGTLTLPEGSPRAAVVLIQGAGPHGRDQVISGAPMFKELADDLARRGIASVRVDNSGVGESTGTRVAHFQQRVPQLTSVLDALRGRREVAGVPIGIIAHSEGTLVTAEIWQNRVEAIDFLVFLGAPGRQGRIVWVDQQSNPERFPGKDETVRAQIRATFEQIADASINGDEQALSAATDRLFAVAGLTPAEIAEARPGFISRMASDEMRVWLAHDPAEAFSRVTDPVLTIWGTHDTLTDPALNLPVFLEHRNEASALTSIVLPNEDHFFLRGQGLAPGEHKRGRMRLSPRLGEEISRFIDDVAGANSH